MTEFEITGDAPDGDAPTELPSAEVSAAEVAAEAEAARTKAAEVAAAEAALDTVLLAQEGVVARRQLADCGFSAAAIRKKLRRGELTRVYPGVYVNHTGPRTWRQRAWAAVLDAHPAALSHDSAVHPGRTATVHIAVDRSRRVRRRDGVVVHFTVRLSSCVLWNTGPPRVRMEEAVLDVAAGARTESAAVAALAEAVGDRRTTAKRLSTTLAGRSRLPRYGFLRDVLKDIAAGACSVLERRYLTDVERAHGLPTPQRQAPTTVGRKGFRDVDYDEWGVVVELDGRYGHDDARSRDRDLDAAVAAERLTLRLGRAQVFDRPCATAKKIAVVLQRRGWPGTPHPCSSCRVAA